MDHGVYQQNFSQYYTYTINLEIDHIPSMEIERKAKPPKQEVVKMDSIKYLDMYFVYPISDSTWVSLV